jgi:hypothetical protein
MVSQIFYCVPAIYYTFFIEVPNAFGAANNFIVTRLDYSIIFGRRFKWERSIFMKEMYNIVVWNLLDIA